jgi:hypothetical protein
MNTTLVPAPDLVDLSFWVGGMSCASGAGRVENAR